MEQAIPMMALAGALAALVTAISWIADRRRMRRADLDRVGFMPWTAIFFVSLLAAILLLGLAAREWLVG